MNEMALTRSKAKHPPDKVMVEAQKVKSKVENSEKRRQKNVTISEKKRRDMLDGGWRLVDEAWEYLGDEAGGMALSDRRTTKEGSVTSMKERMDRLERKFTEDEQRLSAERDQRIASEIDAKAQQLMGSDPSLDYSAATRLALAEDERFQATNDTADQDTDLASAVERKMAADPTNYGDDEGDEPVGSTHTLSDAEYESQVKEAMRNRGYEV